MLRPGHVDRLRLGRAPDQVRLGIAHACPGGRRPNRPARSAWRRRARGRTSRRFCRADRDRLLSARRRRRRSAAAGSPRTSSCRVRRPARSRARSRSPAVTRTRICAAVALEQQVVVAGRQVRRSQQAVADDRAASKRSATNVSPRSSSSDSSLRARSRRRPCRAPRSSRRPPAVHRLAVAVAVVEQVPRVRWSLPAGGRDRGDVVQRAQRDAPAGVGLQRDVDGVA